MIKLSHLVTLFCIGVFLALISTLAPWTAETFGDAEDNIQAKLDAESCATYTPLYINKRLYCRCSDKESQKPNKCNEKYKND